MIGDLSKSMFGRGLGIQILPYGENKWAVVELSIIDSTLSVRNDYMEFRGDCSVMVASGYGRTSIRMETEAHSGELFVFDNFEALEGWLKTRCNKLWPNCEYCGLRYVADEVTCSGCGGPRGDK